MVVTYIAYYGDVDDDGAEMEFGTYEASSVTLALDLLFTRGTSRFPDELTEVERLRRIVADHDLANAYPRDPTEADLRAVRQVRDELVPVFHFSELQDAVGRVNRVISTTGARPRLTDHDGRWHLHYVPDVMSWANLLGAIASTALAHVLLSGGSERLGECAAESCETFFVDTSRNASRRYCGRRCATRVAVRAHRARRADGRARARGQ